MRSRPPCGPRAETKEARCLEPEVHDSRRFSPRHSTISSSSSLFLLESSKIIFFPLRPFPNAQKFFDSAEYFLRHQPGRKPQQQNQPPQQEQSQQQQHSELRVSTSHGTVDETPPSPPTSPAIPSSPAPAPPATERTTPLLHRRTKSSYDVGACAPGSELAASGPAAPPHSPSLSAAAGPISLRGGVAGEKDRPRSVSVTAENPPIAVYPGFDPPNPDEVLAHKFVDGPRSRVRDLFSAKKTSL